MSTSAPQPDEVAEFRALDAEDRLSAIEERLDLEQEFERYDGPLDYSAWLRERERSEELSRLGIGSVEVPPDYADALGADRSERLRRQIEDRLMGIADTPPSHEELAAQARQYGAAARALDLETGQRVVELEDERIVLREEMNEAAANDLDSDELDARTKAIREELGELSVHADAGHPDRWMAEHGSTFAAALAARHEFRRARELEDPTTPAAQLNTPGASREAADAGFDAGM